MSDKAELTLVKEQEPTAAEVAALFERLTGRKPTAEDMREVKKTLAELPPKTTR